MDEFPLFIVDPADQSRKFVGQKQVRDDGTYVWYRRISSDHVMRSGSLGVDAMTYDTQFAGKPGKFRVEFGTTIYEADFAVFEQLRKEKDMGHGRQYFLAFAYWTTETTVPTVKASKPKEKLVFGVHAPCSHCKGKSAKTVAACIHCGGLGYVTS